jgi:hypothetical protein
MNMTHLRSLLLLTALAASATACDMVKEPPKSASLTQRLMMVDVEGRNYGTVEMDPIKGGKVYNAQGVLIGRIVAPTETTVVAPGSPTVSTVPVTPVQ